MLLAIKDYQKEYKDYIERAEQAGYRLPACQAIKNLSKIKKIQF